MFSYVQYPEKLHELYNGLHLFPKRKKIENVAKLVANFYDETLIAW